MRITLKRLLVFGVYFLGFFLIVFYFIHVSFQPDLTNQVDFLNVLGMPVILPNNIFNYFQNNKSLVFQIQICNRLGGNFSRSSAGNSSICSLSASINYVLSHGIESDLRLNAAGCAEYSYRQQTFQRLLIGASTRSTIFSAYIDHRLNFAVRIIALLNTLDIKNLNCIILYGTIVKSSDKYVSVQIDEYAIAPAIPIQLPEWKSRP